MAGGQPPQMQCSQPGMTSGFDYTATFTFYTCV